MDSMAIALGIILFFLGASVASYLCASLVRKTFLSTSKKRSHCDHCQKILSWYELIPVLGFLINAGRCRRCRHRIPTWYFLAEVSGGILMVMVGQCLHLMY